GSVGSPLRYRSRDGGPSAMLSWKRQFGSVEGARTLTSGGRRGGATTRFRLLGWLLLGVMAGAMLWARLALAQVPPHYAGTICCAPQFWCWAQPPGPPGSPCVCPGPQGFAGGVRG